MNGVLLDTSFLISFSDPNRPNHAAGNYYYAEFKKRQVVMYLSTIAVAEFQVKQAASDLPLHAFEVLPFNFDHAVVCGTLSAQVNRDAGDDRGRFKDDLKLIAQCVSAGITHIATEDKNTLTKYVARFGALGGLGGVAGGLKPILLKDGFDLTQFGDGQAPLFGDADEADDGVAAKGVH